MFTRVFGSRFRSSRCGIATIGDVEVSSLQTRVSVPEGPTFDPTVGSP